ncbi:MAG TPA: non-canonical purine NTP pyrophosphatase, partial [Kofleriaceae bacterium]|nr:non-canonical purine NTP pyrophosphatase [Kofleriaceae bacterium]
AEIRKILDAAGASGEISIAALQTGFSTAAPEPGQRARDKVGAHVLAHPTSGVCFAEAVDLVTMDGKSLRLELDSENENRFCKWWRETPVKMQLVVALRRSGGELVLFHATSEGVIADKPAGPLVLGWDRLFVPADEEATLAQLIAAGEISALRRDAYAALGASLAT